VFKRLLAGSSSPFSLHLATAPTRDPAHLELEVDPKGARGKIANPANAVIVETDLRPSTGSAGRFF
jgi:hypothetical protein